MKEWVKLTEELPPANIPVWVLRKNGGVYLAMRDSKPLSTRLYIDCHWYGSPVEELQQEMISKIDFNSNFSDVTVESWIPLW